MLEESERSASRTQGGAAAAPRSYDEFSSKGTPSRVGAPQGNFLPGVGMGTSGALINLTPVGGVRALRASSQTLIRVSLRTTLAPSRKKILPAGANLASFNFSCAGITCRNGTIVSSQLSPSEFSRAVPFTLFRVRRFSR